MLSLRNFSAIIFAATAIAAGTGSLRAGIVPVPNASFETPLTGFATNTIDDWGQEPSYLAQETGLFSNVITNVQPIDNADGNQVAFLFNYPGAAIIQDYDAVDYAGRSNLFTATYEAGKSYTFTLGVIGGTTLAEGSLLELGLYYRDGSGNMVTIAATTVTNSDALFPSQFHLVDFQVALPVVQATDAWSGKHIGIELVAATTDPTLLGGYWDVDNVRLTTGPSLTANSWTNGNFTMTLQSYPGSVFDILMATNPATPGPHWVSVGTVTNVSGTTSFTDGGASGNQRYYRAHQVP